MLHVEAFDVSRRTGGQSPKDGLELVLVADLGLWSPDRLPLRSWDRLAGTEFPPLKEMPLLQVLNVMRNRISDGWNELTNCGNLQALDASQNQLDWDEVRLCMRRRASRVCSHPERCTKQAQAHQ